MFSNVDFSYAIISFTVFIFALTVHEVAHALTANWGGDLSSTYEGRLSLNPIVHMDPFGSVLFPLLGAFSGAGLFGWARPVQVQTSNFRNKHWHVIVSLAGPFSNLLLALFGAGLFVFLYRFYEVGIYLEWVGYNEDFDKTFRKLIGVFIYLNWLLFFFNLLPIPPLDGSHVFHHFIIRGRGRLYGIWDVYSRLGIFVMLMIFWATPVGVIFSAIIQIATTLTLQLFGFQTPFPA